MNLRHALLLCLLLRIAGRLSRLCDLRLEEACEAGLWLLPLPLPLPRPFSEPANGTRRTAGEGAKAQEPVGGQLSKFAYARVRKTALSSASSASRSSIFALSTLTLVAQNRESRIAWRPEKNTRSF